ncbi:MAG: protein kinase, partial [Deltaproteobacteria bacterium]|nr:protein kinase [Deltaproteobacteria bacterium]
TKLAREVALKVLPSELVGDDERRRRFVSEARAAAAASHAHIVTVFEIGEADGTVYIAMELVEGETLRERLDAVRIDQPEAWRIARQVAEALAAAHEKGIVHRDIKPENIMLTAAGSVKVLDFGLAKWRAGWTDTHDEAHGGGVDPLGATETLPWQTAEGRVLGTPGYMSPEQALGQEVGQGSDVFSFGVMLYEMLSGKNPFEAQTPREAVVAVVRDEPAPLTRTVPGLAAAAAELVERCLEKAPEQRPPTGSSLVKALHALDVPGPEPTPTARRRRWGPLVVAVAIVLVAGFASYRLATRGPQLASTAASAVPSSASANPSASGVPITSLPPPKSASKAALDLHRRGLQAMRDSNWVTARQAFESAVNEDPGLAAAHLRLAMCLMGHHQGEKARRAYGQAAELRSALGERNQRLLHDLQPWIQAVDTDLAEAARRLKRSIDGRPLDAELHFLHSWMSSAAGNAELALASAERAIALDASYADAMQMKAFALALLGRFDALVRTLEACVAASPLATDCAANLASVYGAAGRCDRFEETARALRGKLPEDALTHLLFAAAVAWRAPRSEAADIAMNHAAELARAGRLQVNLSMGRWRLDVLRGRFDLAVRQLEDDLRRVSDDPLALRQLATLIPLVALHLEMVQPERAGDLAQRYLARSAALSRPPSGPSFGKLRLQAVLLEVGRLDESTFRDARTQWLAQWPKKRARGTEIIRWLNAFGGQARSAGLAAEALNEMPPGYGADRLFDVSRAGVGGVSAGLFSFLPIQEVGRMYLRAGRPRDGLRFLTAAAAQCAVLPFPFARAQALLLKGQAQQELGQTKEACASYVAVLEQWGKAQPRSVTADEARKAMKQFDCAAP